MDRGTGAGQGDHAFLGPASSLLGRLLACGERRCPDVALFLTQRREAGGCLRLDSCGKRMVASWWEEEGGGTLKRSISMAFSLESGSSLPPTSLVLGGP